TVPEIADKFINAYFEDTGALNDKKADMHPRGMDHMDDIIEFIQTLIDKGHAYEKDGDVNFKTRSYKEYGQLSKQSIDDLKDGASNQLRKSKEDPLDLTI